MDNENYSSYSTTIQSVHPTKKYNEPRYIDSNTAYEHFLTKKHDAVTIIYSKGNNIYVKDYENIYDILKHYDEYYVNVSLGGVVVIKDDGNDVKRFNTTRELYEKVKKEKEFEKKNVSDVFSYNI